MQSGRRAGSWGLWRSPAVSVPPEGPAPEDRYHAIYFAMLLAGVGFLLPYNSFITDVDYLHHKFPGGPPRRPPPSPRPRRGRRVGILAQP